MTEGKWDNTNRGVLFKNEYKKEGGKQPDYKGKINVDGVDKELAAWIKEGKSGKFMSLSVSEPYVKGEQEQAGPDVGDGDNVPF